MARCVYGFLSDLMAGNFQLVTGQGEIVPDVRAGDDIVLFVPGEDVAVLTASVPVKSGPQAREAAAYSVEDEIAVSVEDEHVVIQTVGDDLAAPRSVHIVSTHTMEAWTDWLQTNPKFASAKLIAAPSVLPADTVLNIDGVYLANIEGRAFVIEPEMPDGLVERLIGQREVASLPADQALTRFAGYAEECDFLDLRQGAFQGRSSGRIQDLRAWRTSAILAAALLLVWVGSSVLQIRALNQETEALKSRTAQTYRLAFPEAPNRTNYVRAVGQALDDRGTTYVDFRDASRALYQALQVLPDAELRVIRYDEDDAGFVARIAYSAYGEDALLKTALSEAGFAATLGALRQEGTKVVGEVAFGGAAP